MDFFEAQALAKKRTGRLIALFALAVVGLVAAGYLTVVGLLGQFSREAVSDGWWQPHILAGVLVVTLTIIGIASLVKWLQLRNGGSAIAEMVGARAVPLQTTDLRERQLLNIVEEMSIAAGLPLPGVYLLDDETGINAFAAGLTTGDAVVAVTRGTLEKLTRDELQGVVAHEFSHILNGDMRLNVRLTAILFGILVIGLIGRGILESLRFGRRRGNGKQDNGVVVILAAGLILIVLGYVGYFFGRLIQASISRQREFLADASAVQFTRNPAGIAGALKKIGGYALGSSLQASKSSQLGHFFFAQGFRSWLDGLWATHPPLEQRIRALDSSFDGRFFEPPEKVDINTATWASCSPVPPPLPHARTIDPVSLIASIGTLETRHIARARDIATTIPAPLLAAVRTPSGAAAVVCGLVMDQDPALRARQHALLAGQSTAATLAPLETDLRSLPPDSRLPLLLLTPPALRQLPPIELERLLGTLDELVLADDQVSLFEFALQKVLTRQLGLARQTAAQREIYAPADVSEEISVVLSFGARLADDNDPATLAAFHAGAAGFSGLHPPLVLTPAGRFTLEHLDQALDKLAQASGPVKKRLLSALAATVAVDGRITPDEADLIRALASALDCPIPPVIP